MKTIFKLEANSVEKAPYQTKQMSQITAYLESLGQQHFTVADVKEFFKSRGISVGTTTIYRQLEKMVALGTVAKFIIDEKSGACFSYLGKKEECHHHVCIHCKCEKCGKLIHLECDELSQIARHLSNEHNFKVNAKRTVIYGVCDECRNA